MTKRTLAQPSNLLFGVYLRGNRDGRRPDTKVSLDKDTFNFIEGEVFVESVVELSGAGGFVSSDACGDF